MNKILSNIANDKKLSTAVIACGTALSIVSHIVIFLGVYYSGVRKGVTVMQVDADE